ncbi:MAG: hypothetical protein ACQEQF_07130 [Bacillota bacterium]
MTCKKLSSILKTEVKKHLVSLSPNIFGFVYFSSKGTYHILLNKNISEKQRKKVLIHEYKHLLIDLSPGAYIIGLDLQKHKLEKETCFWTNKIFNMFYN